MMRIKDILTPERTLFGTSTDSQKSMLECLSNLISQNGRSLDQNEVLEALVSRERLGSTGLGLGIAIPHARISDVEVPIGAFVQCHPPIPFDASDNQTVDLFFGLLVPEENNAIHLQLLAQLAKGFSDKQFLKFCRSAGSSEKLYEITMEQFSLIGNP